MLACSGVVWTCVFSTHQHVTPPSNPAQITGAPKTTIGLNATGHGQESDSNSIVRDAAQTLAHGPALTARLRYKINMFGQQTSGPGRYLQKGQGTRMSRIEFEFGYNDTQVQLHQFSDGDFLYSLTIAGNRSNLEFVDLRQLETLQMNKKLENVSSWLSVGSLTGLLDQLAEHFTFGEITIAELDSIPVIKTVGVWKSQSLERLLEGQVAPEILRDRVNWSELPEHLPHQVELTLGNDERFPLFPYRIVFNTLQPRGNQIKSTPVAVLEFFELQNSPRISNTAFQLPSIEMQQVDVTSFYKQRLRQFTR